MIKAQMTFPLAVDTTTVKATTNILYSATDDEVKAYTIGYIPWEMMQKSVFYRGLQYGDFAVDSTDFKYTIDKKFRNTKGVPFCYSYALSAMSASLNAFNDGNGYVDLPWGTASTAGLIHAYNTDYIVNNTPNHIADTYGIGCHFKMLVTYVPEGGEGGASTTAGENGWCTRLADKDATLDLLTLAFSIASSTDGSYMPTPVTFTQDDLRDAVNGVMSKTNGTTTYGGVTFNITVYCVIEYAYIYDNTSTNLKDGIVQGDRIRSSQVGSVSSSPFVKQINNNSSVTDSFTCNGIEEGVDIQYPATTAYFVGPNEEAPCYFKFSGGLNQNWYIAGSLTLTDLKIIRSIARPIYKFNSNFYVAEFNDDFTITGELIPYAQARDWQKNINPDNNEFDYNDIPDPSAPDDDDTLDQFSGSNIFFNLGNFGATNGFITHWVMTRAQVSNFGTYVWQNLLDFDNTDPDNPVPLAGVWENLKVATKTYFTTGSVDPASLMQLIVGLRFYPFDLNDESTASTDNCIYFGTGKFGVPVRGPGEKTRTLNNMAFKLPSTSIVLPSSATFWYKDFRDYEGCTAFIYLPFCGTYQIPISEIVPNTQFDIDYEVDLATGSCTAYVSAVHPTGTTTGPKTYPVIVANGQCGFEVPLSATNANRLNATIIADAQKVVGAIAGPINESAGKVISGVTSAITGGANIQVDGLEDIDVGGLAAASAGPMGGVANLAGQTAMKAGGNLVNVAAGMATRSGCAIPLLQGGRGWSALGNPLKAYLQIRRGRYMYAKGYEHSEGRPENRQLTVSDITGFFQCDNVDMSGVGATSTEVNMIKRMLETGVYRK